MAGRKHLVAVNRTIRAGGLDETGLDAAIVEFSRDLARRMDSFDLDKVPLNLVRAYQSALKDLQRAHGGFSASRRRRDAGEESDVEPDEQPPVPDGAGESEEGALAKLRREKAERKAAREAVREDRAEDLHEAAEGADSGD